MKLSPGSLQKYIWWKKHLTKLQLVQFVAIMVHEFQLLFYDDCDFPWQYPIYIGVHVLIFFFLFGHFYVKEYLHKKQKAATKKSDTNGPYKFTLVTFMVCKIQLGDCVCGLSRFTHGRNEIASPLPNSCPTTPRHG